MGIASDRDAILGVILALAFGLALGLWIGMAIGLVNGRYREQEAAVKAGAATWEPDESGAARIRYRGGA